MKIDVLSSLPLIETRQRITPRDAILYALGVGATDLRFVYEDGLMVLPTMAVILAYPGFIWKDPRLAIQWQKVVHGETSFQCHAPFPVDGTVRGITTIGPIIDKGEGKGAIVYQTREVFDGASRHLATVRNTTMLRGDGGFGGTGMVQQVPHGIPDRPPDKTEVLTTAPNQALIYRLSGDLNPLHVDPPAAVRAGFERPILHGLCTFGVAGRSLLSALAAGEPGRVRRMDVRFVNPVFPGEKIQTEIWHEGKGRAAFRAIVVERGIVALNNGYMEFE
jgi:acyl dehydratase